jgi:hypothetical protein
VTGERSRARAALGAAKARAINSLLTVLPPRLSVQLQYLRAHRRPLNLRRPTRFTEKIQLIKLYGGLGAQGEWVDKVCVKPRVAAILGDDWIIPTLWHGPALPPRPERTWPTPYLIKANHGSGWNLHVDSDADKDWARIEKTCARWQRTPWLPHLREGQYSGFTRQVLIEPRIGDRSVLPVDYKFWVFCGRVEYVSFTVHQLSTLKHTFFDRDWNRQPFTHSGYSQVPDKDVRRPIHFLQMRDAAETLGRPFPFARIDLYDLPEGPKFGEITLTPLSGHQRFTPDEYDMHLGTLLDLDAASIPPR